MGRIKILDKTFKTFIEHDQIVSITEEVAAKLNRDYKDAPEPPVLMCILTGSIPFAAELMKHLDFTHVLSCMKVSSYEGMQSTGIVKMVVPPTLPVKGRDVIICEDIIDTGLTIRYLRKCLEEEGARSVKVCTLMLKPTKFREMLVKDGIVPSDAPEEAFQKQYPEYCGKEIGNDFILGFGFDYNNHGRNFPDIYVLDEE